MEGIEPEDNYEALDQINKEELNVKGPDVKEFVENKNELEKQDIIVATQEDISALLDDVKTNIVPSEHSEDLLDEFDRTKEDASERLENYIESLPEDED